MKIARAYVATKAEVEPMMKAANLPREHVKCGEVAREHISDPKWTMRKGELLAVFDLTAFGGKRAEIAAGVARIQERGADVCEVESGDVCGKGVAMLHRALKRIHAETHKMTSDDAKEMARKAREARQEGWAKYEDARVIWGSPAQYSETQALLALKGWPRTTMYRVFGKRKELEAVLVEEMKAARATRKPKK